MKVSALKARTRTVPIVIPGADGEPDDQVMLTYRPGSLTLELWESLQAVAMDPQGADIEAAKTFLMDPNDPLVVEWDLENEDGSPFPCDPEHLAKLPLDFLGLMTDAIGSDSIPNASRGGTSEDGSPQKAPLAVVPGGTESSEQPTGSDAAPGN